MNRISIKIISIYILFFIFLLPISSNTNTKWIDSKNGLRMRYIPSVKGIKICVIPYNSKVNILKEKNQLLEISGKHGKWTKVRWKDKTGWVFGGFLTNESPLKIMNKTFSKYSDLNRLNLKGSIKRYSKTFFLVYSTKEWVKHRTTLIHFNRQGNISSKILYGNTLDFNYNNKKRMNSTTLHFKYSNNNYLVYEKYNEIKFSTNTLWLQYEYKYDNNGNCTWILLKDEGGYKEITITYNDIKNYENKLISIKGIGSIITKKIHYTYMNNLLKTAFSWQNTDGTQFKEVPTYKHIFTTDKKGNILTEKIFNIEKTKAILKEVYVHTYVYWN